LLPVASTRLPGRPTRRAFPRGHRSRGFTCLLASGHGVWSRAETPTPAERVSRKTTMLDVSDRFLHQLAADRRASLQCSRKAVPLRTALGAFLARVGVAAGRDPAGTGPLHRPRPAFTNPEEETCSPRYDSTGSTQGVGKGLATEAAVADRGHDHVAAPGSGGGVNRGALTRREQQVALGRTASRDC